MVSGWMGRLGGRGRGGGSGALVAMARDVVGRRRSLQSAVNEIRHAGVLDALADDDFRILDQTIAERMQSDREFAGVLARLTHTAARAKGFERQTVDAALRLDAVLPPDDPGREREKLLRDAYSAAQRSGYVRGGRMALARLGYRAFEAGDTERARALLGQQLDLATDTNDTPAEVDAAIMLGDIHRRDGDPSAAQALYRRAGRSAQRLDYYRGVAEALVRQIELMPPDTGLETIAQLQRQALDAAERTGDRVLQGRIVLGLAGTLTRCGRTEEALGQYRLGVEIARETGDLSLENRCLSGLVSAERQLGRLAAAAEHERDLLLLEERLGNRAAAAEWAIQLGTTRLALGRPDYAIEAFERALILAEAVGDSLLAQRALGGLGTAQASVGHAAEGLDHLMRALDLARRTGDAVREAQWLGSIGQALWRFGQTGDALRAVNQAINVARRAGDAELEAGMLALMGRIQAATKQASRARECFVRALEIYRRLDRPSDEVALLSALGGQALELGQPTQAEAHYEEALRLATGPGERAQAARLHGKLGKLAQKRGDQAAALDHLSRAVELAEEAEQLPLVGKALQHLATAQHAAGHPAAAETYRRALAVSEELGDANGEALVRLNLGLLLSTNGHRAEGLQHLHHAVALAARMGEAGTELRQRAEAALATAEATGWDAAGAEQADPGDALGRGWPWRRPSGRDRWGGAGDERGRGGADEGWGEDQVADEATLPPE